MKTLMETLNKVELERPPVVNFRAHHLSYIPGDFASSAGIVQRLNLDHLIPLHMPSVHLRLLPVCRPRRLAGRVSV